MTRGIACRKSQLPRCARNVIQEDVIAEMIRGLA
jgi:hypothetical protein